MERTTAGRQAAGRRTTEGAGARATPEPATGETGPPGGQEPPGTSWHTTQDPDVFEAAAGEFLRARPVEHTLLLSVASSLRVIGPDAYGDDAPWFGWWGPERPGTGEPAGVGGAFVWTPPRPVLLSPMPDAAAAALAGLRGPEGFADAGVNAERAAADAYATGRRSRGGTTETVDRRRLYRLGELTPPSPAPPGAARAATRADRPLVLAWFAAFAAEIGDGPPSDPRAVDGRIDEGRCVLWESGGAPVAMAGFGRTLSGVARVAPVYTPPELRGRGYAGAATAAASQAARRAGAQEVLLFTDPDNPTSNALYQRLGYRPVADHLVVGPGRG